MWPVDNLANRFENHEPDAMVAYIGDRPVGAYSFIWAGQDLKADEILSNGIWVDDGARRSGIGTKLRNRLYEYLKSQGFRKFSIVSVKDTDGAQRFQLALSASEGVTINFSDDGKKVSSVIIDLQKFRYRPMPGNSAASKAGAAAEMSEGDEPEGVPSGSAPEIATQVDFVQKVAGITERLKERKDERVVIIADSEETALDIAILANKTPGVRAAWCFNAEQVKLTRQHNDANILIVLNGNPQTDEFIKICESTRFDGVRHQDRLDLIKRFEQEASNRHTKGKPETAAGAERKIAIGCDHGALELK